MIIYVNGKEEKVEEKLSIGKFLALKNIDAESVFVELNMEVIQFEDYLKIFLNENDSLEILKFVGGG
ncbi:MAG: thiamine biosynthesis protein ThiS [Deltaproteobacteria bacterium]|nr:MAG: thiamine biosynthesis protein ThiS [Deltaproteobacteria bacterium]